MKNFFKKFIDSFTITEKTFLVIILFIFLFSGGFYVYKYSQQFMIVWPERGGTIREGVIGVPRLINPILASTETDMALTSLIYSGLLRSTSEGLIPDIAKSYEASEDMTQFTFQLKRDIVFHDGTPLTADDVIYTIEMAKNPNIRSAQRANWEGIEIEKINNYEIIFNLPQPYPPFLQNLTLGILPKHIWENFDENEFLLSNSNLHPVGTGPYKIFRTNLDSVGIPVSYTLESFSDFVFGKPKIDRLVFKFAKNQEDLLNLFRNNKIDLAYGFDFKNIKDLKNQGINIKHFPLPRMFGIFLNQNENNILVNRHVRQALQIAIPKEKIIEDVMLGFASKINSPIPETLIDRGDEFIMSESLETEERIEAAIEILKSNGWSLNDEDIMTREVDNERQILGLTLSTNNTEDLVEILKIVGDVWEKIGVDINIEVYNQTEFNTDVIRPRNFEALLFGIIINKPVDLYAFWHSSQRLDPGLNITSYANIDVNKLLEDLRTETDPELINEKILRVEEEIINDIPAIFIYSPHFTYVVTDKINNMNIENISSSKERFSEVYNWYLNTRKIWRFLAD